MEWLLVQPAVLTLRLAVVFAPAVSTFPDVNRRCGSPCALNGFEPSTCCHLGQSNSDAIKLSA